jgi:subtilase family serine protease
MSDNVLQAKLALSARNGQLASTYAENLTKAGFQVIKITPRGVYFQGSSALVEKTFHTKIEENKFVTKPVLSDFADEKIASIYIPTEPIRFP